MICPVCRTRWADFPEEDFDFIEGKGFIPRNDDAVKRRKRTFDSNEIKYCGCNDEYLEVMAIQAS
jgi:hypothetical protein